MQEFVNSRSQPRGASGRKLQQHPTCLGIRELVGTHFAKINIQDVVQGAKSLGLDVVTADFTMSAVLVSLYVFSCQQRLVLTTRISTFVPRIYTL